MPGRGPPGGCLPSGDGSFPSGGPSGPPGLQGPPGPQGPDRLQGSQGLPNGGPGDPNITFNTTGLKTSLINLGRYIFYLLDAQQVTNEIVTLMGKRPFM